MDSATLQRLVDAADAAALLRAVDGLAATREWDGLVDLARRCRDAVELGKQLWPVAMHIDYRLAWEAPAPYAARVLVPGAARFALGPLTEVAASTHDWSSLSPHIHDVVSARAVAQERVIRGEDLTGDGDPGLVDSDLPLRLAAWEPGGGGAAPYALPTYRDRSAKFPQPEAAVRHLPPARPLSPGARLDDDPGVRALEDSVETWVSQSAGRVRAVVVDGDAGAAVAHLASEASLLRVSGTEALALLQWAGASGGAYGRRRGGAAGRFAAWWAAAAVAGLEWPVDPNELGEALGELDWFRWGPPGPETGWVLRLAVCDPVDGLAWAVDAVDQRGEDIDEAL